MQNPKETDMYPALKTWLTRQGYTVRGEVKHCDLAAEKDGQLIVIELKLRPSMALLAQAARRQEYADAVYTALPATREHPHAAPSRDFRRLLKRLGVGLIQVTFLSRKTRVEVLMHPGSVQPRPRPKQRAAILREIAGRPADLTPGGLPGGASRVTAYRQRALRLVSWLSVLGPSSPARLRKLGAPADTGVQLSRNLYGWFERVKRGVYQVHPSGNTALSELPDLDELFRQELEKMLKQQ